ncbi:hypothetical protein [Haloferax volcanii]|uniref:hypothetical protein n=1 Tax=Haloferax volcanii TaxID=2246 RepID=UPI0023D9BE93|nr:hypothetical protein [Haloferax lucentense]WEL28107.1 hypothetical protein SVXHx_5091 [Haloferax lucentense]
MSVKPSIPDEIRIGATTSEYLKPNLENRLERIYGSGTYISDYYEASDNTISIKIGNAFPKDVSDCRQGDRVIKFISIDDVASLTAVPEGGSYTIELEPRSEVHSQFLEKKNELRTQLDQAMARTIYSKIARTPMVENQLSPIKQILRWTRRYHPVPYTEVQSAQRTENTLRYVKTLEELGFVRLEDDNNIYPGKQLNKYDLDEISTQEFNEKILGDVVKEGYKQLSDKLGLKILRHFPKFSNAYYLDAIERRDPTLCLDLDTIWDNLEEWYGRQNNLHEYVMQDKLDRLTSLDILEEEGDDYYRANEDIYNQFSQLAGV